MHPYFFKLIKITKKSSSAYSIPELPTSRSTGNPVVGGNRWASGTEGLLHLEVYGLLSLP